MRRKSSAAIGGRTMMAASAAMLPMMPTKMMTGMSRLAGARATATFISVSNQPDFSATPTPIMAARTTPSGGKLAKFFTASSMMRTMFSRFSRLTAVMVLPSAGLVAVTPASAHSQEAMRMMAQRMMKMKTGSGSLLPAFSTPSRKRVKRLRRDVLTVMGYLFVFHGVYRIVTADSSG